MIDAIGGYEDGIFAGGALKEAIEFGARRENMDFIMIQQRAADTIRARLGGVASGAVFMAMVVDGSEFSINMAGDCRFLQIREGKISKVTKDEGTLNGVKNSVSGVTPGKLNCPFPKGSLESGDVAILLTDGAIDNFVSNEPYYEVVKKYEELVEQNQLESAEELLEKRAEKVNEIIRKLASECTSPKQLVEKIKEIALKNMYSEGGKVDDLTLFVYMHN